MTLQPKLWLYDVTGSISPGNVVPTEYPFSPTLRGFSVLLSSRSNRAEARRVLRLHRLLIAVALATLALAVACSSEPRGPSSSGFGNGSTVTSDDPTPGNPAIPLREVGLERVFSWYDPDRPTHMAETPGGTGRIFVSEQDGRLVEIIGDPGADHERRRKLIDDLISQEGGDAVNVEVQLGGDGIATITLTFDDGTEKVLTLDVSGETEDGELTVTVDEDGEVTIQKPGAESDE